MVASIIVNMILGTISRISIEKGILNLLFAFKSVAPDVPDLRLIIVGGFPEEQKNYFRSVNNFIEKENLTERVRILGYQKDALKILKCMDFYISSSLSEGLPISILEASASGIPIIATEIAGNKDILLNSVFGVLVEPDSPKSLVQGIVKMIQLTQNERTIITQNASNRVKNYFSIEEMVRKTDLLYKQVLNNNSI